MPEPSFTECYRGLISHYSMPLEKVEQLRTILAQFIGVWRPPDFVQPSPDDPNRQTMEHEKKAGVSHETEKPS